MVRTTALDRLLAALDRAGSPWRRQASGYVARCPAHDDRNPSLTFTNGNGKVLLECKTGCPTADVLGALALEWSDLFDTPVDDGPKVKQHLEATYDYHSIDGALLFQKLRYFPKDFRVRRPVGDGWAWGLGDVPRVLYRLPHVLTAIAQQRPVFIVEGEKDADRLADLGHTATCNFDGASRNGQNPKWRTTYADTLAGAHVVIVADNDGPGIAHAQAIALSLTGKAKSVHVARGAVTFPGADVSDHLDAGYTLDDLVALDLDVAPGTPDDPPPPRLTLADRLLDRSQLASLPKPAPLVHDTIDLGTVVVLAGYWGTCKSFIAQDWMACVATGKRWQGRAVERRRVLYIAAEGAYGLDDRLWAWEYGWRTDISPDDLHVLPVPVHLGRAGDVGELIGMVSDGGYEFVVVDTIAKCIVGMDENSAQDMGRVVDALYRLREATGHGTVLGIHHTGKDKITVRGSSALEGGVDTVYTTEGDAQLIRLTRTKRKDGPRDDYLQLCLSPCEHTGSAVLRAADDLVHPLDKTGSRSDRLLSTFLSTFSTTGASKSDLRTAAEMPPVTFYRALNDLLTRGELIDTGTEHRPFYRKGQLK